VEQTHPFLKIIIIKNMNKEILKELKKIIKIIKNNNLFKIDKPKQLTLKTKKNDKRRL